MKKIQMRSQKIVDMPSTDNSEAFWTFLDEVVTTIDNSNQKDIEEIYDQLKVETRKACTHLERRSCLYFIATIKDGLYK